MTKTEALDQIPGVLDELDALEQEKTEWLKEWRERRKVVEENLEHLRRVARGEETLFSSTAV